MIFHIDKILFICCSICILNLKVYKQEVKGQTNSQKQTWEFEKVVGSNLYFKNAKPFKTNLYNLQYIGQVSNGNSSPFLILSGRDCDECDANISIYIRLPKGQLIVESNDIRYQLPGTERDLEDKTLIYKGRAFYGQILPNIKGVIWYQNELMENGTWEKSIYLVSLNHSDKKETTMKDQGQIQETLKLLKQGLCKEIPGTAYTSEP